MWRAGLDHVNEVEPRVCLQLDLVHVYAETSRRSCSGRQVRDLTTAHEARKSPRGDYCSSYTSRIYMKGWVSKGERLKIAERRRRGKLRKAREGRIIGEALQPRYGFKYMRNAEGKAVGYEVDLKKMANVRMISRCSRGQKLACCTEGARAERHSSSQRRSAVVSHHYQERVIGGYLPASPSRWVERVSLARGPYRPRREEMLRYHVVW